MLYALKVSINATKTMKLDASDMKGNHSIEDKLSGKICPIRYRPLLWKKKIKKEAYVILFKGNQSIFYTYSLLHAHSSQLIVLCLGSFLSFFIKPTLFRDKT